MIIYVGKNLKEKGCVCVCLCVCVCVCVCVMASLCCTGEIITTLYINYTSIKLLKMKKKKELNLLIGRPLLMKVLERTGLATTFLRCRDEGPRRIFTEMCDVPALEFHTEGPPSGQTNSPPM